MSEIVNTPKPGEKIGERLKNDPLIRRVGVLEYDTLPAGLAHDLETAAPAVEWIDGTAMFAGLRRADRRCRARASGTLRRHRVCGVARGGKRQGGRCRARLPGLVEQSARLAGAEEAYIAVAPDLDADTPAQPHVAADAAGGALRGARVDCLQGLLGSPHADLCEG